MPEENRMVLRTAYLPGDLDDEIRVLAFRARKTKSELIVSLLREALGSRGIEVRARRSVTPEFDVDVPAPVKKPGYHLKEIEKGVLGEASKVREECDEFMDAVEQDVKVMALVELSDMMGAVGAYLDKHHPGMTLDDLQAMRTVTERAFRNGRR